MDGARDHVKLVIATDNRFWREQIGSQKRIASLFRYLVASGHEVVVFFVGAMYPPDENALPAFRPEINVRYDRPQSSDQSHGKAAPARDATDNRDVTARARAILKRLAAGARAIGREAADVLRGRHPPASILRRSALRSREPTLGDFRSARTEVALAQLLREFRPDGVIVEYVRLQYLARVARSVTPHARLIVDTHDVMHERCERFHRAGELHEVDITPDEERAALGRFDLVLAIQSQDAEKLRALTSVTVIVAGYPYDVVPVPAPFADDVRLVFGGADMAPNVAAATELVTEVWPRINALQGRSVPLHLFGAVCEHFPRNEREGLRVHGFVDDLGSVLRPGDILVNLVRFGGGLKIKNVEALCHGMAVITTGVGAEGLDDGANSAFRVVDSAEEAATEADRLLRDMQRLRGLCAAAVAYARARFSPEVVYRELADALTNRPA